MNTCKIKQLLFVVVNLILLPSAHGQSQPPTGDLPAIQCLRIVSVNEGYLTHAIGQKLRKNLTITVDNTCPDRRIVVGVGFKCINKDGIIAPCGGQYVTLEKAYKPGGQYIITQRSISFEQTQYPNYDGELYDWGISATTANYDPTAPSAAKPSNPQGTSNSGQATSSNQPPNSSNAPATKPVVTPAGAPSLDLRQNIANASVEMATYGEVSGQTQMAVMATGAAELTVGILDKIEDKKEKKLGMRAAELNAKYKAKYGYTLLEITGFIEKNDTATIKYLLDKGLKPNLQTVGGVVYDGTGYFQTALQVAITSKANSMMRLLIQYGADINLTVVPADEGVHALDDCVGTTNWTPLHFAARYNNMYACEYLLAKGANNNIKASVENKAKKFLPWQLAQEEGHYDVAYFLKSK
jgi:hypothetical protein